MSPERNRRSQGFRRHVRAEKHSFNQEKDIRSWMDVRELVMSITPEYEEMYAKHDSVLQNWHKVRLEIADLPLDSNFSKKAGQIRSGFIKQYEDPKSKTYNPDLLFRLEPVLKQITNLVANRLR